MRERAILAGAGATSAGALVTVVAVDNGAIDRGADVVLFVALLGLSRAVFRIVEASVDYRTGPDPSRRRPRAGGP